MDIQELNTLVGKRHEENKTELRRLDASIRRLELELAEKRGTNHAYHALLAVVSTIVIPLLVVALEHFWK